MKRIYTLGDVAEPGAIDTGVFDRFSAVVLGVTPRPGQMARVTRFDVDARMEQELPGISKRLRWEERPYVQIRGGGVRCDPEVLEQAAHRMLLEMLQSKYDKVFIDCVGKPKELVVPEGKLTFQPKILTEAKLNKRMQVWVDVFVDGQHFHTLPIWFAVSVKVPVLVARNNLEKGRPLALVDVTQTISDIADLNGVPLASSDISEKRTTKPIVVGAVLVATDVGPIPAVCQGELISVFARCGSVSLEVKGIALSDGDVSQIIEVKSPESGESYRAMVLGKKQARVN